MSHRIVSIILGRNTPFDYTYSNGKNVSKLFSSIINNYKSVNSIIEKPAGGDDTTDYWKLFFRYKFSDSVYDSGKYTAFARTSYNIKTHETINEIEEVYAVITMRQLQLALNQPYINLDTNKIFRLYQNFNLDKSYQDNLIFDMTSKDIPMCDVYRYTQANDNLHNNIKYTCEDLSSIGAIAQTIDKLSLEQVSKMLNIIKTHDKTKKSNYYKNHRNRFKKIY